MCAHLVSLGIDAEMVEKGAPEDIGKSEGYIGTDLGSIRVRGREIDVIHLSQYTGDRGREYSIEYAIKSNVKGREEDVKAYAKWITKGFFRPKFLGFEWTGGEIVRLLEEDGSLKEYMLQEYKKGLKGSEIGAIGIRADKERPYVRIDDDLTNFPSKQAFECYNTIAKHIRSFLQGK